MKHKTFRRKYLSRQFVRNLLDRQFFATTLVFSVYLLLGLASAQQGGTGFDPFPDITTELGVWACGLIGAGGVIVLAAIAIAFIAGLFQVISSKFSRGWMWFGAGAIGGILAYQFRSWGTAYLNGCTFF